MATTDDFRTIKNVKYWRLLRRGEPFTTPSGLNIILRRVSLFDLVERGRVPAPLVGQVEKLAKEPDSLSLADFDQYAAAINVVVLAAVAAPLLISDDGWRECIQGIATAMSVDNEAAAAWFEAYAVGEDDTSIPLVKRLADDLVERINVSDLPMVDRMAIFGYANDMAASLIPFRAEPGRDGDSARSRA